MLGPNHLHVWWLATESPAAAALCLHADSVLDDVERAHRDDALTEDARRERELSRTLLRTLLERYTGCPAANLRFRYVEHGRPELDGPAPLRFSVSHTDGAMAVAITRSLDVGIDVEAIGSGDPPPGVAETFFAASEIADLDATAADAKRARFFEYWTLKEAYAKARGLGFAIPFRCIELTIDESIGVRFSGDLVDDSAQWHFERLRPSDRHTVALACRAPEGRPATVFYELGTPGGS